MALFNKKEGRESKLRISAFFVVYKKKPGGNDNVVPSLERRKKAGFVW
ncbi:hypothetical protein HN784_01095 [bacterium]|jgi:hypothetical protein|nr:hypothetical protein [bacterium]MBT4251673.1 hypothetical protein [bacterium]MBT4597723.1 hypothetical protein [bacterium]MBT6753735.1 hypothetical protein [bacterium]MBT7037872.1 hypothetical protein [bacterium]